MIIKATFTDKGTPKDGLTPTVRIVNLPGLQVEVSGAAMTENTELTGSYFYDFAAYSPTGNYDIKCNGGSTLADGDRYTYGVNSDDLEIGTGITEISGITTDIKIKTDYLPDDTSGQIAIVMGLLHRNIYTRAYWDSDDMTGAIIDIYDSAANANVHNGSDGLLLSLGLTGTFIAGKLQTVLVKEQ